MRRFAALTWLIFLLAIPSTLASMTSAYHANSVGALQTEADMAFKQGRMPVALELYRKILEADPSHLHALQMSGYILYKARYFDQSRLAFDKLLDVYGESFTPLINLGNIYLSLSMPLKALRFYEKARAIQPDDVVLAENIRLAEESIDIAKQLVKLYSRSCRVIGWGAALACLVMLLIAWVEIHAARAGK